MLRPRITPVCTYCGKLWPQYKGSVQDIPADVAEDIKNHVSGCPENPLVKKMKGIQAENEMLLGQALAVQTIRDMSALANELLIAKQKRLQAENQSKDEIIRALEGDIVLLLAKLNASPSPDCSEGGK